MISDKELSDLDPVEGPEVVETEKPKRPLTAEDAVRFAGILEQMLWPKDCQGEIEKLVRAAVRDEVRILTTKKPYQIYEPVLFKKQN